MSDKRVVTTSKGIGFLRVVVGILFFLSLSITLLVTLVTFMAHKDFVAKLGNSAIIETINLSRANDDYGWDLELSITSLLGKQGVKKYFPKGVQETLKTVPLSEFLQILQKGEKLFEKNPYHGLITMISPEEITGMNDKQAVDAIIQKIIAPIYSTNTLDILKVYGKYIPTSEHGKYKNVLGFFKGGIVPTLATIRNILILITLLLLGLFVVLCRKWGRLYWPGIFFVLATIPFVLNFLGYVIFIGSLPQSIAEKAVMDSALVMFIVGFEPIINAIGLVYLPLCIVGSSLIGASILALSTKNRWRKKALNDAQ